MLSKLMFTGTRWREFSKKSRQVWIYLKFPRSDGGFFKFVVRCEIFFRGIQFIELFVQDKIRFWFSIARREYEIVKCVCIGVRQIMGVLYPAPSAIFNCFLSRYEVFAVFDFFDVHNSWKWRVLVICRCVLYEVSRMVCIARVSSQFWFSTSQVNVM